MKKINLLIIIAFIFNTVNAQFSLTSGKEAAKIKNSILLVSMEEENPKTIAKLSKKDKKKLNHYKEQIAGRNSALKNAVQNYWSFSDKVEYLPASKVKMLMKTNKDKYVNLKFGEYLDYEKIKTNVGSDGKPAGWQKNSINILRQTHTNLRT